MTAMSLSSVLLALALGVSCVATPDFPAYNGRGYPFLGGSATGFFHTQEAEGRWWLVDPNGQAFYMVGTDHANFRVHSCQKLGYAPYQRNNEAQYGSEDRWAEATLDHLEEWGFNTLPANHSPCMRHRRFPHIQFMSMGSSFAREDDICPITTWTGFPNVFSPDWPAHCDAMAAEQCAPNCSDPWLIGYFLDNELEWLGKTWRHSGLFEEAWKKPADHSAKRAWLAFLKEQEVTPATFAEDWGVTVASIEDLAVHQEAQYPRNEHAMAVATDWARLLAERYFQTCHDAIRRHDPNHMIFGCRFAGDAPDVWEVAGRYCDVVSFNTYPRIDVERGIPEHVMEQYAAWHRAAGKPMMVTEWSFPALDSGLPCAHGAGMRVDTQRQRAACFTHFQRLMFSMPFMVGSNFFMWVDEPAPGISESFPEDSNYGLVNEWGIPYGEFVSAVSAVNRDVYEVHRFAAPQTVAPLSRAAEVTRMDEAAFSTLEHDLNGCTLIGPDGPRAWRIARQGRDVALFYPVLHQRLGESWWPASGTARFVRSNGDTAHPVLDMEFSFTPPTPPSTEGAGPFAFKAGWRFRLAGDWFSAECLWVENTDAHAWELADVYHYFVPTGVDSAEITALPGDGIPNYYVRGAAWANVEAQYALGCTYFDEQEYRCRFWKDEWGNFHGDLNQPVNLMLAPGQRVDVSSPPAFFFVFDGAGQSAFSEAVARVSREAFEVLY